MRETNNWKKKKHFEYGNKNATYQLLKIHNEIICLCGATIKESIVCKVKEGCTYRLVAYETADISGMVAVFRQSCRWNLKGICWLCWTGSAWSKNNCESRWWFCHKPRTGFREMRGLGFWWLFYDVCQRRWDPNNITEKVSKHFVLSLFFTETKSGRKWFEHNT